MFSPFLKPLSEMIFYKKIKLILFGLLLIVACTESNQHQSAATTHTIADTAAVLSSDTISQDKVVIKVVPPDYDTTKWSELIQLDTSLVLDIRYATANNFVEEQMYECGRCFLRPDVAKAVVKVHRVLQQQGLGLKLYDCYRPRPIQWKLWEKVPDPRYVTNPKKGSMHNKGAAVDLTIVDAQGRELDMGTDFDYFGVAAYHTTTDLPETVWNNRQLLKGLMEKHGFKAIRTEWWHYYYTGTSSELSDMLWNCTESH